MCKPCVVQLQDTQGPCTLPGVFADPTIEHKATVITSQVAVFLQTDRKATQVRLSGDSNEYLEVVIAKMRPLGLKSIIFLPVYHRPLTTQLGVDKYKWFQQLIATDHHSQIVVGGDFNANMSSGVTPRSTAESAISKTPCTSLTYGFAISHTCPHV